MKNRIAILFVAGFLTVGLMLTGCEESVNPVIGTGENVTLYGFLDPRADTQAVRIYPIAGMLASETGESIDVSLHSVNRQTGESVAWQDSVVRFYNGTLGHVYYGVFRPEFETAYRLEASSSEGETTTVDVITPPSSEPVISHVQSAGGLVRVDIDWHMAPHILETRVWYNVWYTTGDDTTTVRVPVTGPSPQKTDEGVLRLGILPSMDIGTVYSLLQLTPGLTPVYLNNVEVEAFVASSNWESPTGRFIMNELVQPGTFSNVMNGFGFVGGGYLDTFTFELTDEQAENAGYEVE